MGHRPLKRHRDAAQRPKRRETRRVSRLERTRPGRRADERLSVTAGARLTSQRYVGLPDVLLLVFRETRSRNPEPEHTVLQPYTGHSVHLMSEFASTRLRCALGLRLARGAHSRLVRAVPCASGPRRRRCARGASREFALADIIDEREMPVSRRAGVGEIL